MSRKSAEQQARDLLEQYGLEDAQSMAAGDLVELANLIADANSYRGMQTAHISRQRTDRSNHG